MRRIVAADHAAVSELAGSLFAGLGDYGDAVAGWLIDPAVEGWTEDRDGAGIRGFVLLAHGPTVSPPYAYLLAIGVEPASRRGGLGSRLLRWALQEARAAPYRPQRVELAVAVDNSAARALFRAEGFIERSGPSSRYPSGARAIVMVAPGHVHR